MATWLVLAAALPARADPCAGKPPKTSQRCCVQPIDWTACWYPDWRPGTWPTLKHAELTNCCGEVPNVEEDFRNWAEMLTEAKNQRLSLQGLSKSLLQFRQNAGTNLDQSNLAETYFAGVGGSSSFPAHLSLERCCLREPSIDWRGCWFQPRLANNFYVHEFVWDPVTVHVLCEAAWSQRWKAAGESSSELSRALEREVDLQALLGIEGKQAKTADFLSGLSAQFASYHDEDAEIFRQVISAWQFPSSCEGKKFLVAAVPTIPGLGAAVLTALHGFQLALRLGRIFVLDVTVQGYANPMHCKDRKMQCYFEPLTSCRGSKHGWHRGNIIRTGRMLDSLKVKGGLEDLENIVAWILHDPDAVVPEWIAGKLRGTYGLDWLYHQLAKFMLRPAGRLQRAVQQQIHAAALPLGQPFMSVHFRAGTRLLKVEGFRRSLELHLNAIREGSRLKGLRNVLWTSDDETTFQAIQDLAARTGLNGLSWFKVPTEIFPAERTKMRGVHPMQLVNSLEYDSDEMSDEGLQFLALMLLMSASQFSILGQFSSGGRLIAILRNNQNLYDVDTLIWGDGPPDLSGTQCFLFDVDCMSGNLECCRHRELIRRNRSWIFKRRNPNDKATMTRFNDNELL